MPLTLTQLSPPQETISLGALTVPRLFVGLWQLSSPAWGSTTPARIRREMLRHIEAGYTAFGECRRHRVNGDVTDE